MIKKPPVFEFSAGGILYSSGNLLLIKTRNLSGKEVCTFPKGKIENKESSSDAARREVFEETGVEAVPEKKLGDTRYLYLRGSRIVIKKVIWYRMRPGETQGTAEQGMTPAWHSIPEALSLLSYTGDSMLLKKYFT